MRRVIVDTNILLLYAIGLTSPDYIGRHKRLGAYSASNFKQLALFLSGRRLVLTPNTVTETSNLLRSGPRTPITAAAMRQIALLLRHFGEDYVPSLDVATDQIAAAYGITDAVLFWLATQGELLLTVDRRLIAIANQAKLAVIDAQEVFGYRA